MPAVTRTILRDLGLIIHIPGAMALFSVLIALLAGERFAVFPFLFTGALAILIGQTLYRLFQASARTRLPHAMVLASLSWLVVPLLGSLPFLLISTQVGEGPETLLAFREPWNALFEAFSGFTSTGLTVAVSPDELPRSLQWWRSFMEWVGGIGVIVLMLIILDPASDAYRLYRSEGREKKILPNLSATVRIMGRIYFTYTLLAILLLRVLGVPWWEALNHGMTSISTGGFTITGESIAGYSVAVRLAMMALMVLGAISFATHFRLLFERKWLESWQGLQPRALLLLLIGGTLFLLLENRWFLEEWLWMDSMFQWTSALTTSGFSTATIASWSPTAQLLLTLAMVIGGSAGSTAGGIKLNRITVIYKGLIWRFKRTTSLPHELIRYEVDGEVLTEGEIGRRIEAAGILVALWFLLLLLGVIALLHMVPPGTPLNEIVFEASSALSSVGLSTGITAPELAWQGKLTLIMLMWMGRLEIIPVFILFTWPVGRMRDAVEQRMPIGD
ncbi:MAG: TrkH family potassium uptake protein [Candidatus Promineifilaceae bacterium]|nr:TrkH family potassium uptake protein [Candidatus Promineifilaceae bacterium]